MAMGALVDLVLSCLPHPTVSSAATLAATQGAGYDGEDRLSALPDGLLHEVVARLPIRDAVRTATLSARWCNVWRAAPLVLFDEHISASTKPEHVVAISSVLAGHAGPFRTVHLDGCGFADHEAEIAQWTRILADRGVENLVLVSLPRPVDLALPAGILRCAKLRRLYLGFWKFPDTTDILDGVADFPELRELAILAILMEDRDLDRILASSPALEKLGLVMSYRLPKHFCLFGQNLNCVIFYESTAIEVVVAEAPCLERLVLWEMEPYSEIDESEDSHVGVRIVQGAPALKVLGYLDTRVHQLRFGDNTTVIKVQAGTKASPICRVPSVKILAIKVNFNVFAEVQILPNLLGCFPSIEVLHIESAVPDASGDVHNPEFFQEISPIECVQLQIRKVFIYNFQGYDSEMAFLKYLALRAKQMQKLTLVLPYEKLDSEGENKIGVVLGDLLDLEWASEACTVFLLRPAAKFVCCFHRAFDLSIEDPFLLNDGKELFSVIKEREQDAS
ncbi:unnamed protein product [Urochloa decumbens]|uniref:F-box domain-containing protein n=1 Tax=Urochloa decumbens TaxID=240449 RepID=A0ABC8YUY7_9POAL